MKMQNTVHSIGEMGDNAAAHTIMRLGLCITNMKVLGLEHIWPDGYMLMFSNMGFEV